MDSNLCATLNDANKKFLEIYPQKTQVISAVNRFILTELGLVIKGKKITEHEKEKAKEIANNIILREINAEYLRTLLSQSFKRQRISLKSQKAPRSYINFYIGFLENNFFLKNKSSSIEEKNQETKSLYRIKNNPTRYIDKSHLQKLNKTRKAKQQIQLRLNPEWYLADYQIKYSHNTDELIISIIEDQLTRIKKELENFKQFCFNYITKIEATLDTFLGDIKRLLGWLYLQEQNLARISLTNLVPVFDTNLKIDDFEDLEEYALAKEKCKYNSKKAAKNIREFLTFFFTEYQVVNLKTQKNYIFSLITLAKYLYRDITDDEEVENYEDIVIIQNLRNFSHKLTQKTPCSVKTKSLKFTWNELLIIREQLQQEASLNYSYSKVKNGGAHRYARPKSAIAVSKMRFLIFCFLTLIPPDRARTIRELQIGETLKHGIKTQEGFISRENLLDSANAKYYIHLQEKDYKTGKIYGEFWGELPNYKFKDNTLFYDYLTDWIYGEWRKILLRNETHNYCFCQSRTSKPHSQSSFHWLVAHTFKNKTGIKMGTHQFRDIFCTHLEEINAPAEVRASAAYWMKHSEQIAKKVYTVVDLQAKLAPAFDFMNQLNY